MGNVEICHHCKTEPARVYRRKDEAGGGEAGIGGKELCFRCFESAVVPMEDRPHWRLTTDALLLSRISSPALTGNDKRFLDLPPTFDENGQYIGPSQLNLVIDRIEKLRI